MKDKETILIGEIKNQIIEDIKAKYYELIYAVENKYPGETRHENCIEIY